MQVKLDTLVTLLGSAAGGTQVRDGWAGGTVALWAVNAQSHVICLTDQDGPFCPRLNQVGEVGMDVTGFAIGVYADEEDYLAGGDLIRPLVEVTAEPGLDALREALARACATSGVG